MKPGEAYHVVKNRFFWNATSGDYQRRHEASLRVETPAWGVWRIPEAELGILGDVAGKDVLELGCGGAQWSVALALAGARVVGLDVAPAQLAFARELAAKHGADVELLEADAEQVPLEGARFDVVFADHGAFSYCDPDRAVAEAARLVRPGGLVAFSIATPWLDVCWQTEPNRVGERLERPYFGIAAFEDENTVSFQRGYGDWIRLFRRCGLEVEDLVELRPPAGAATTYTDYVDAAWASRWPAEHVWRLRRR